MLKDFSIIIPPEDFGDCLNPELIRMAIEDIFSSANICPLKWIIVQIEGYLYPLILWFDYPTKQIFVTRLTGGEFE